MTWAWVFFVVLGSPLIVIVVAFLCDTAIEIATLRCRGNCDAAGAEGAESEEPEEIHSPQSRE